jgi:hypothetical protein
MMFSHFIVLVHVVVRCFSEIGVLKGEVHGFLGDAEVGQKVLQRGFIVAIDYGAKINSQNEKHLSVL